MPGLTGMKRTLADSIRAVSAQGIPVMGYYFSVAGPGAQILSNGPYGRGGARSIGYVEAEVEGGPRGEDHPVPRGQAWGTQVAADDGRAADESATVEEMWERLTWFLERLVPVRAHVIGIPSSVRENTVVVHNRIWLCDLTLNGHQR